MTQELTIYFGQDQEELIDGIIKECGPEHIIGHTKLIIKDEKRIKYTINFKDTYGMFIFLFRLYVAKIKFEKVENF